MAMLGVRRWKTILTGLCGVLAWNASPASQSDPAPATSYQLMVRLGGSGTVTSSPAGISCRPTCTASLATGTSVKLTALAAKGSYFAGWSGACKGTSHTCQFTVNSNLAVTATFRVTQTVNVLKHIIFMAQENRGLDHYFGALRAFWAANKFSDQSFDGLPQFNPASGIPRFMARLRPTRDATRLIHRRMTAS